jgi:DNA-binding response OmpR family regulator
MQSVRHPAGQKQPYAPSALRALLAEDDEDLRRLLAHVLRQEGYLVVEVGSGSALIEQLAQFSFDLVVSDARIPGWSGFRVRASLQHVADRVPAVLLSSLGDRETAQLARSVGAMLLSDPLDIDGFRAAVGIEPDTAA